MQKYIFAQNIVYVCVLGWLGVGGDKSKRFSVHLFFSKREKYSPLKSNFFQKKI